MQTFLSRDLDETSEVFIDHVDPALHAAQEAQDAEDAAFEVRLRQIVADITLPEQYRVLVARDQRYPAGRFYFQIEATRADTFTGELGTGRGGKAYLSPAATTSELVQTIFGLYNAYLHHEARETFLWRGRRVYGPHVDVHAHWQIAEQYDARPTDPHHNTLEETP